MYIYVCYISKGGAKVGRGKFSEALIERLDCDEEVEDGFLESAESTGNVLMNFGFTSELEPSKEGIPINSEASHTLIDNRKLQPYITISVLT